MMKQRKLLLLILLICSGFATFADQVRFTMSAPKVVELGEQFRLSMTLNKRGENLQLPKLDAFNVLMGPSTSQSTSYQSINGKSSRTVTFSYTFILQAKQEGKFEIAPAKIDANGKTYTSNPIAIQVVKGSAAPSGGGVDKPAAKPGQVSKDDLFVKVNLSRSSVYKGEHLLATIKIYSRVNLTGFDNVELPNFEGFWSQEIDGEQQISLQREAYNGEIYNVGTLKRTILFPQQTGKITIGPVKIDCLIRQRVQRPQGFFDDFFDSFATVKASVSSAPVSVSVKALPPTPANFSGGVGKFNFKPSITQTHVKENDAVTLKFDITGNGNIKLINPPTVNFPADFEVYDPKTATKYSTSEGGVQGKIGFEYLFLPRYAGDYTIPPVKFVYFDPSSRKYITKQSQPFELHVEKGEGQQTATVMSTLSKEDVRFIGKDIRYIKQDNMVLIHRGAIFFGTLNYYLLVVAGAVVLLILFLFNQHQIKENANVARVKNRKASKVALKQLKEAKGHLKGERAEAFYESVMRAFWGYLSDKLTLQMSQLNRESATTTLRERQVSDEVIGRFVEILDTCEFARFAPGGGSEKMSTLYREATEVMSQMEKEIK